MTPLQQKLYDEIKNLHGGDAGYADLTWRRVEEVMAEIRMLTIADVEKNLKKHGQN